MNRQRLFRRMAWNGRASIFAPVMITSVVVCIRAAAQEEGPWEGWATVTLHETPRDLQPAVPFLSTAPTIDGILDEELAHLPPRPFNTVYKKEVKAEAIAPASYRLAYGTAFLYAQVEVEADRLTFRDRAFQMGDGFYMTLGMPREDNAPATEFFCVAGSAVNRSQNEWTRGLIWFNSDRDLFVALSQEARMSFAARDGKISFELLLPWHDVHPLHPWFTGDAAFNLTFTKAVTGDKGEQHRYMVIPDPDGQYEGAPKLYARVSFEEPQSVANVQTYVQLERNHVSRGEVANAKVVSIGPTGAAESISVRVTSGDHKTDRSTQHKFPCNGSRSSRAMELSTTDLPLGHYEATWTAADGGSHSLSGLTVLPRNDLKELKTRVGSVRKEIAQGSYHTLLLYLDELQREMSGLSSHQTGEDVLQSHGRIVKILDQAEAGEDIIATQTGFFRRGFRSALDGAVQPYAVQIPRRIQKERQYPLIVFLHGSAEDERALANFDFLSSRTHIVIAPRARGTQNAYLPKEARQDIAEAIADAKANYPVDPEAVVLVGFSMGGYGAYRTFYDKPQKFRALAVFSGSPDVDSDYKQKHGDGPSFLDERFLTPFHGTPVFIFHGTADLNCPYAETEELVSKLEAAGAEVEFVTEEGTGHSPPGYSSVQSYRRWLKRILKNEG